MARANAWDLACGRADGPQFPNCMQISHHIAGPGRQPAGAGRAPWWRAPTVRRRLGTVPACACPRTESTTFAPFNGHKPSIRIMCSHIPP